MKRSIKEYISLGLKGMAMGAADVVPGVSGGTIAFISGIYEELINSIKSIDHISVKVLFKEGIPAFLKHINARFLITLLVGIGISVVSLVRVIHYLLDNHPILIWSFFFGLILASAFSVAKQIKKWNFLVIILGLVGIGIAYFVGVATPSETPDSLWFVFISGMLAICAMILPGISGSFILLLLKKYEFITGAISDFNISVLGTFAAGAAVGITSFSHLLSWLFKRFHDATIAILSGFMIGSLNIVWPWKEVIETRLNSKGIEVPFRFESVLPNDFSGEPQMLPAFLLMILGIALILLLDRVTKKADI